MDDAITPPAAAGGAMSIDVKASELPAALARLGVGADELVTVTSDPAGELLAGRREARARVLAAGLTDSDIDRLIKEAQKEVEPLLK